MPSAASVTPAIRSGATLDRSSGRMPWRKGPRTPRGWPLAIGARTKLLEVSAVVLVEQRAGAALAQTVHGVLPAPAKPMEYRSGHERGSVESHATMDEQAVSRAIELGKERGQRADHRRVGDGLVLERVIEIEERAVAARDSRVQCSLQIHDRRDRVLLDPGPVVDHRRNEEALFVV